MTLVLAPYWPLISGMVHTASAVPIEVPFSCRLRGPCVALPTLAGVLLPRSGKDGGAPAAGS